MIHLFHRWSKWSVLTRDCYEEQGGRITPYLIQQKQCLVCEKRKVDISIGIIK